MVIITLWAQVLINYEMRNVKKYNFFSETGLGGAKLVQGCKILSTEVKLSDEKESISNGCNCARRSEKPYKENFGKRTSVGTPVWHDLLV